MKNSLLCLSFFNGSQQRFPLFLSLFCLFLMVIPFNAFAQEKQNITGIVTDDRGETIIGATITVPGATGGTITDIDGKFYIPVVVGADLKVSCIGYLSKTVKASGTYMKIVLSEETKMLSEAIAIGYGSVKRENLLGSVSSIVGSEIEDIPAGNLSQTIVGKMAAVNISQTTGRPGSTTPLTIRMAGSFSTGSSQPIFVIDGIVYDTQTEFDMLDPSEVESISVLKDAAAAVYGARGAAGAVVVTLKKGKEGKAKISYSGQAGFTMPTRLPNMLSASEHATLLNYVNNRSDIITEEDYANDPNLYTPDEIAALGNIKYDWLDAAWQSSYQVRNTLNISGGSDKVRYFAGGSLWNETGNFKNIDVKKYTLRTSLEADLSEELTAGLELSLSNENKIFPYMQGDGENNMKGLYKLLLTTSYWIPYKVGDRYVEIASGSANALALLDSDCYKRNLSNSSRINASLSYKPKKIPGLTATIRLGYTDGHSSEKQYSSKYTTWEYGRLGAHNHIYDINNPLEAVIKNTGDNQRLSLTYGKNTSYQLNAGLSYLRSFGKHNVSGMFNYEQSESASDGLQTRFINQMIPNLERLEAFGTYDISSSNLNNSGRLGFIGRFNYDYDSKYLIEASFREEASIKFDADHRWGFFPQVALGWRVSEESFFKDNIDFIDYFKVRASAGLLGQDNGVSSYEYLFAYTMANAQYFGTGTNDGYEHGLQVDNNGIVTSNVTWEKTRSYNLGFDTKFIDSKLDFTIEGYFRHTWDIFDRVNVSFTDVVGAGVNSAIPDINNGIANSWGIDVELGYNGIISQDANYFVKGNISWGENKIIKKFQDAKWEGTYAWKEGHSTNQGEEGYLVSGILRNQEQLDVYITEHPDMTFFGEDPQLGMLIYEDIGRWGTAGEPYYVYEPDGVVDDADQTWIGGKNGPIFAYGISLGGSYKTFRANMTFSGGFGGSTIMNKDERCAPSAYSNVPSYWTDSWTHENPDATYPSVIWSDINQKHSTFWIRSSSVLRLTSIDLSYNMPKEITTRLGVPSFRVFLTATNLFTLYSDFDYKDANLSRYYDYPLLRTINLGLNISL